MPQRKFRNFPSPLKVLAVTSPDRLYSDWRKNGGKSHAAKLLAGIKPGGKLVTLIDGHPATLSWLGGVMGHRVSALGVEDFGQCGTVQELYRKYGLDAEAIAVAYAD